MMMQIKLAMVLVLGTTAIAQTPAPLDGYVPTAETAIQIAKVVLEPMIGKPGLKSQEAFHAELNNGVWEVFGRWPPKPGVKGGGGVDMRISKKTGEIIGYYFSK
jgi:NTF2 fold immunity protein